MSPTKVAVRVRPFSDNEKLLDAKCCIEMSGQKTILHQSDANIGDQTTSKAFVFDHSYWSHDGFCVQGGHYKATEGRYADQQKISNDIGESLLDEAIEGYNVCLIAYGQTGSGKSYTMIGDEPNSGIIYTTCNNLFTRIQKMANGGQHFDASLSVMQIYNERIQDLLVPIKHRLRGGLKVRHHPQLGSYVPGLSRRSVNSYEEIKVLLDEALRNRAIGATTFNETSSRAHMIVQIRLNQVGIDGNGALKSIKSSDINFIDLAGSEKTGVTGVKGDKLVEGAMINLSLSNLCNVVSELVDNSVAKQKAGQAISFSESTITQLLQNTLGGNSKAYVISTISPASTNYEETLSTLLFAEKIRSMANKPVVNIKDSGAVKNNLESERELLRQELSSLASDDATIASFKTTLEGQIARITKALESIDNAWENHINEVTERVEHVEMQDTPFLVNLNDDPLLSGRFRYYLPKGVFSIGDFSSGTQTSDESVEYSLGGLGVIRDHINITVSAGDAEGKLFIATTRVKGKTFINGSHVLPQSKVVLNTNDIITFGHSTTLVFIDPTLPNSSSNTNCLPTWEETMRKIKREAMDIIGDTSLENQINLCQGREEKFINMKTQLETERVRIQNERSELERRKKEEEATLVASYADASSDDAESDELESLKNKYNHAFDQIKMQEAHLNAQKQSYEKEYLNYQKMKETGRLYQIQWESILPRAIMLIEEGNLIAQEMGVGIFFSPKLSLSSDTPAKYFEQESLSLDSRSDITQCNIPQMPTIQIRVEKIEDDTVQYWPLDLYENKMFNIRQCYSEWDRISGELYVPLNSHNDPFTYDPEAFEVLGQCYVYLDPLKNLLSIEQESFPVFDIKGRKVCNLKLSIAMNVDLRSINPENDLSARRMQTIDDFDTIEDIRGQSIQTIITIHSASDLPEKCCRTPQVTYKWASGLSEITCSAVEDAGRSVTFNESHEFKMLVDDTAVQWFHGTLILEVSAKQTERSLQDEQPREKGPSTSKEVQHLKAKLAEKDELLKQIESVLRSQGKTLQDILCAPTISTPENLETSADQE